MKRYDMVVIGGGTGGIVCALIAAAAGARVALVERERTGGDCLWTGCVPSKSLIAAAALAHRMRNADAVGLEPVQPAVDFAAVMRHVHAARERIAPEDSPDRLRRDGVEVIESHARFVGPGRIEAGRRTLAYRTAVIATGSRPLLPPIPGLEKAGPLTSDDIWELRELPRRLVVMGGGSIGCELGQAYARLGSAVTLVELEERLLDEEEPEASALIASRLTADGVEVKTATTPTEVSTENDRRVLLAHRAGGTESIEFDCVLVATGRRPQTDGLGLEDVGVTTDERGAVHVDSRQRTSARNVFAVGDVTGALAFTHAAAYQARNAAQNALFRRRLRTRYDAVPRITFTDPEVARVGLTESQARLRWGAGSSVVRYGYERLDRAITAGEAYGFAKLVAGPRGRLVGATVAAPAGGEAIVELAGCIDRKGKVAELARTVHPYPTFGEGQMRAAIEYLRERYATPRTRAVARPLLAVLRAIDRPA